jgi:hypothetical protein
MAQTTDENGRPLILRSPRQASKNFGLDQASFNGSATGATTTVPRPKFLFVVRFIRNVGEGGQAWSDGLSIAVRKIDRPTISPIVQELNQYNKKRLIQTGIKYGAINIDFHDTTDSVVHSMWNEYSSYYFGDQRHTTDSDWTYDVVSGPNGFLNSGEGFGFTLPDSPNEASALSSSFFFKKVEVYQLFGGKFVQFDLIHPKITSFNPDEMDYESPNSNTIRMSMEFETIITHNKAIPQDIAQSEDVKNVLVAAGVDGDAYALPDPGAPNYPNVPSTSYGNTGSLFNNSPLNQNQMFGTGNLLGQARDKLGNVISGAVGGILKPGGALGSLGNMNFGNVVTGNNAIGQIINGDVISLGQGAIGNASSMVNYFTNPQKSINGQLLDVALGAAGASSGSGIPQLGMAASFMQSGSTGSNILSVLNSSRNPTAQVGFRSSKLANPLDNFDPNDF